MMAIIEKKGKGYDEYEIKHCLEVLMEAEEIKADKKKMKALAPLLTKKKKAIESLDDLRSLATSAHDDD